MFHLCIITKKIPYQIAWGGNLKTDADMYIFESISISLNLFLSYIVLMKGRYLKFQISEKWINLVLWGFLAIFILNTIGNLFSKTNLEKCLAALTFLFALLIWNTLRKNINHV